MPLKLLPTNITNFQQLRTTRTDGRSYACADKTGIVVELVNGPNSILITRPPRFMKSATLSLLKYFFDIRECEANALLFENMTIRQPEYRSIWNAHQGQYPVILISFKDVKCDDFEGGLYVYQNRVSELYSLYSDIVESLNESGKKYFSKIIEKEANEKELQESLRRLIEFLYQRYHRKVVVLIDEYDTPLYSAHEKDVNQRKNSKQTTFNSQFEITRLFMTKLLGSTLKDNPYIERSIMTGVLRTAFASLVSTLNDVSIYSVLSSKFAPYFGLTYTDIDDIVKQMGATLDPEAKKELVHWYNGYEIDGVKLYNPWSINQFLSNYLEFKLKIPRPYWLQVGDHLALVEYMQKLYHKIHSELTQLMLDETITVQLNERTLMVDLEKGNEEAFWGLLVHCGYLTVASVAISLGGAYDCQLRIPNYEVKGAYAINIQRLNNDFLKYEQFSNMRKFLMSLVKGEIDKFKQGLKYYVIHVASYFDFRQKPIERHSHTSTKRRKQDPDSEQESIIIAPEIIYHVFMLGLLSGLHDHFYRIRSNRENGYGRFDLALSPYLEEHPGIIFEFKQVADRKALKKAAETALKQIKDDHYQAELEDYGVKRGIHIGIGFCGKRFELITENVTYQPKKMFHHPRSPLSMNLTFEEHSSYSISTSSSPEQYSVTKPSPKIYKITLPENKKLYLEAHATRGDGNCRFYALPIAGGREAVRDILLSQRDDVAIRTLVAAEIRDAVMSDQLPKTLPDLNYYQTWRERYFALQTTQDGLIRLGNLPEMLKNIEEDIQQHWQVLVTYTESKSAFENYIQEDTGKTGQLSYYQDLKQTSVVDALAQIKNLRIYIFQECAHDPRQLKLVTVRGPEQGMPVYHLHHYRGTDTHFELLSETVSPVELKQKTARTDQQPIQDKNKKLAVQYLLGRDSPLHSDSKEEQPSVSSNISSSKRARSDDQEEEIYVLSP